MYIVLLKYLKPLEEVVKVVVPHRAFLDTLVETGTLIVSGPQIPRTGGVFVLKGIEKAELESLIENDPFKVEGIAEYTIIEFDPVKQSPVLKGLV